MKYPTALLTLISIFLMGCDKNKEILTGPREEVFKEVLSLQAELKRPIAIPASENVVAWPMAGGNAAHKAPLLALSPHIQKVWSTSLKQGSGREARLLNGPIIAQGKVFAIDAAGDVSAFNLQTGESIWTTSTQGAEKYSQSFGGGLAYDDNMVFAVTASAEVLALQAQTGKILWRQPTTAPIRSSPTVANQRLYVMSINNQLDVFDCKTGQLLWTQSGITENAGILGGSSAAVMNGIVVVPYSSGEIFVLREDGSVLWSDSLAALKAVDSVSSLAHIKARPVIHKNKTLVISHSGRMSLYDLRTGQVIWSKDIGGIHSPAVTNDTIFMVSNEGILVALDFDTGKILWSKALPRTRDLDPKGDRLLWSGPVVVNGQLALVGSHGTLIFCSAQEGTIKSVHKVGSPVLLSPIGVDGFLVLLTDDGDIIAYH